ncbi:MAG: hypothetical protein R3247_00555 [Rhodothermales bacterium]|nr:hypothetical protein [Rhodothermales bacterium]
MRRAFPLLPALVALLALVIAGCDAADDESGTVTLTGQVLDAETNNPIANAFVRIVANLNLDLDEDLLVETDADGQFTVDLKLEATTEIRLVATKNGFSTDQIEVLALAGRTVEVPRLRLRRTRAEDPTSGTPSNILLLGQSQPVIGVIESGSAEVTRLTFQVADSAGNPVTLDQGTFVRFSLGQQPGGGEFIAPTEAETDNNGQVTVNLSSGTRAGVVQINVEADVNGKTIRSKPVGVTIHGGLPDQRHFTLGPAKFNFPGLLRSGVTNGVSVIVGDKWANPVRPGTAVYFTTNFGVVEGSVSTNGEGRGTVDLISGNPLPPDGVAIIEAETADENNQRVTARIPVLFSGYPVIQVSPGRAYLDTTYALRVTDQNGNPLSAGTSISVRAEGTKVKTVGNTAITLDDTIFTGFTYDDVVRGPGFTQFTFGTAKDLRLDEGGEPELETVTITVSGPNGSLECVLTRAGTSCGTGKVAERRTDGSVILHGDLPRQ